VPGHEGIKGNETADQLVKLESRCQLTEPEPALGILAGIAKKVIRDWTNRDHQKYLESLTGVKQAKGFLQGPCQKNQGTVKTKHKPVTVAKSHTYRTPLQSKLDK
jgi:hypothetical protein